MGAAGRERACVHFDWATIARRTLDVYRSAIAE
jgi:glycosyltransferase involved in cell wall biosynthesis